jgi:hypothetical protein
VRASLRRERRKLQWRAIAACQRVLGAVLHGHNQFIRRSEISS